jgi:hypothetical protein
MAVPDALSSAPGAGRRRHVVEVADQDGDLLGVSGRSSR